eukprot:749767-Hanusia_phi.AAC.5
MESTGTGRRAEPPPDIRTNRISPSPHCRAMRKALGAILVRMTACMQLLSHLLAACIALASGMFPSDPKWT